MATLDIPIRNPSMRASRAPGPRLPFVLTLALVCALPVSAQQPPDGEDGPPASTWGVGLGAASKQKPYIGMERDNKALPMLQFENRYVRLFGPQLEVKLPSLGLTESQQLNFGLLAKYDGSGYKAGDAAILAGMDKRKSGMWAGAKVEWENPVANVTAEWLGDASGNSKGQMFGLGLENTGHFGRHLMLTPRVTANWQDGKYIDYYYGVRAGEARVGRAAYKGESGVSLEAGVRGIYMLDRHQSFFLDLGVSSLPSQIKDSPLVNRSTENTVLFGYLYRF